uniref:Uncharacterized protein n=1 Tax=Arundo donax TaxID=35708 RepID=A0A0A8ZAM8_ARUDO
MDELIFFVKFLILDAHSVIYSSYNAR